MHFEVWSNITLKNNTIRCKKLATIDSARKKYSTTLHQAKTGKDGCRNVTATYVRILASCYIFSTRNNCSESLAPYGVIFQSDIQLCKLGIFQFSFLFKINIIRSLVVYLDFFIKSSIFEIVKNRNAIYWIWYSRFILFILTG